MQVSYGIREVKKFYEPGENIFEQTLVIPADIRYLFCSLPFLFGQVKFENKITQYVRCDIANKLYLCLHCLHQLL